MLEAFLKAKLTLRKSKTIWILSWGVIKDNSKGVEVYMRKGTQGKFKKSEKQLKT